MRAGAAGSSTSPLATTRGGTLRKIACCRTVSLVSYGNFLWLRSDFVFGLILDTFAVQTNRSAALSVRSFARVHVVCGASTLALLRRTRPALRLGKAW